MLKQVKCSFYTFSQYNIEKLIRSLKIIPFIPLIFATDFYLLIGRLLWSSIRMIIRTIFYLVDQATQTIQINETSSKHFLGDL